MFGGGIWGLARPPSVCVTPSQAVVLSHQRRHLQLLRIRQQEAKCHRTSHGVGLCEGSYRRQLPTNARSPADSLAPVSGGEGASWGMGQRGHGIVRVGRALTQALPSVLSALRPSRVISRAFEIANWDQAARPQPPTPSWTWILTMVPLYPSPHLLVPPRPDPKPPLIPPYR